MIALVTCEGEVGTLDVSADNLNTVVLVSHRVGHPLQDVPPNPVPCIHQGLVYREALVVVDARAALIFQGAGTDHLSPVVLRDSIPHCGVHYVLKSILCCRLVPQGPAEINGIGYAIPDDHVDHQPFFVAVRNLTGQYISP